MRRIIVVIAAVALVGFVLDMPKLAAWAMPWETMKPLAALSLLAIMCGRTRLRIAGLIVSASIVTGTVLIFLGVLVMPRVLGWERAYPMATTTCPALAAMTIAEYRGWQKDARPYLIGLLIGVIELQGIGGSMVPMSIPTIVCILLYGLDTLVDVR